MKQILNFTFSQMTSLKMIDRFQGCLLGGLVRPSFNKRDLALFFRWVTVLELNLSSVVANQ